MKSDRPVADAFARLSGTTSSVLSECSDHEKSVAAKLGATVLIPFSLGMAGGGYTLWSLTRDVPKSLIFGLLWGFAILLIDVAVMALLTKHVRMKEKPDSLPSGLGARFGHWLGNCFQSAKRSAFPLLRLLMAGVLGYVMSHALVLGLFNQRIFSEIEKDRRAELVALQDSHDTVLKTFEEKRPAEPKPPSQAYAEATAGTQLATPAEPGENATTTTPENETPSPTPESGTPTPNTAADPETPDPLAAQAQLAEAAKLNDPQLQKYEAQVGRLNLKLQSEEARRLAKIAEVKEQELAVRDLRLEANDELYKGAKSGKPGAGPTYQGILKDIKIAEDRLAIVNADLKGILTEIDKVKEQIRGVEQNRVDYTTELLRMEAGLQVEREQARREFLKIEQSSRQKVYEREMELYQKALADHESGRELLITDYNRRKNRLETESRSDLLWQEEYLQKIASKSPQLLFWKWMILAMLLMLDTLPVLLKAFKSPSEYDYVVAKYRGLKVTDERHTYKEALEDIHLRRQLINTNPSR